MDFVVLDTKSEKTIPDELTWNYQEMDEAGKEKLFEESEKILGIHKNEESKKE